MARVCKDLKVGLYEEQGLTFADADRHGRPLTLTTPAPLGPTLRCPVPRPGQLLRLAIGRGGR
jgi:hypothetical protein